MIPNPIRSVQHKDPGSTGSNSMACASSSTYETKCVVFLCVLLISQLKDVAATPMLDNTPQIKYDIFVSFRGEDVRDGFLSHLIEAFHRKQIYAFFDDKLERGDEIWSSLVEAIEGSFISLIIFSQHYASSRWCLEELVKVLECRENYEQILIPVFYNVDPTNVRHQKGSYENAFAEHEKRYNLSRVQSWRHALNKSANLSGVKSSDFRNDAELLEEIINLVLMKLNRHPSKSKGLVGIDKPIAHLESLLCQESKEGVESIRSIRMHLSAVRMLKLNPHIFTSMSKLQFLDFDCEYNEGCVNLFSQGIQSLPSELRYLRWMNYPLKSLPKDFLAEKLVILDFSYNQVEKLWHEVENLVNSKEVEPHDFILLKKLLLNFRLCDQLTNVNPSIFSLDKLGKLDLNHTFPTSLTSPTHLSTRSYPDLRFCHMVSEGLHFIDSVSYFVLPRKHQILHLQGRNTDCDFHIVCIKASEDSNIHLELPLPFKHCIQPNAHFEEYC
ncbi:hypothetical protein VNO77_07399 [Canavalia gladiata]|uniref:TIR domain-containing protein n=1 Tax=Canavalia gladiata TaxID=3824 RepID=A0AAN9MD47_CANGL